jgi:uncharacterized protein YfbU (UPF0304 family)
MESLPSDDLDKIKASYYGYLPQFDGFDGNNETELKSIARFFVNDMKRWRRFKGRDFDSHSPTAGRYRRMVRAFEPMRRTLDHRRQLSAKQIIELVEAGKAA